MKTKSFVSGQIVVTEGGSDNSVQGEKRRAVVAGAGEVWVKRRRGRYLLPAAGRADAIYSSVLIKRRALRPSALTLFPNSEGIDMPNPAIRGDVNADGEFTVSDLTFLKGSFRA